MSFWLVNRISLLYVVSPVQLSWSEFKMAVSPKYKYKINLQKSSDNYVLPSLNIIKSAFFVQSVYVFIWLSE